jgi:hypothetical protein
MNSQATNPPGAKPPGVLKSIPTAIEERLGLVTLVVGVAGILTGLGGLGLLIAPLVLPGEVAGDARARLEGIQRAVPGYLAWEFFRFAAQAGLSVLAVVAGVGLRQGWTTARQWAGRYGGWALALQAAAFLLELLWIGPALGDSAADALSVVRFALLAAGAVFAVHALLLPVLLAETDPGPLVWELDVRTPEGGKVVMPADVKRPGTKSAAPARVPPFLRRLLLRVGTPAAGVALLGAVAWSGVSLWSRPATPRPINNDPISTPPVTVRANPDTATPPPPRPEFPQPPDAVRAFDAHGAVRVIALGYTADGAALVTVGRDGVIRLWGPKPGPPLAELAVREPSPDGVVGAAVAPDGRAVAVATSEGPPKVYDLPGLKERPPLPADPGRGGTRAVAFAADGRLAAADEVGFRVWESAGQLRFASPKVEAGRSLAFAPDGRTLALGGDKVRLCDPETGQVRHTLRWDTGFLTGLAFSPDGTVLAASSSTGLVTLWDVATGRERSRLRLARALSSVAFAPDGRRVVAGGTEGAALHFGALADNRSLGMRVVFLPPGGTPTPWLGGARAIAFRPDGQEFAVACGGAVAIYPAGVLPPG